MSTKAKETPEETPKETPVVVDDTAKAQPPAVPAPTFTDKDGIERVSVISDDGSWTPAPSTVSYPKAN